MKLFNCIFLALPLASVFISNSRSELVNLLTACRNQNLYSDSVDIWKFLVRPLKKQTVLFYQPLTHYIDNFCYAATTEPQFQSFFRVLGYIGSETGVQVAADCYLVQNREQWFYREDGKAED